MRIINCRLSNALNHFLITRVVSYNFIKIILKNLLRFIVWISKRDFIYVEDVCEALINELEKFKSTELKINTNKFLSILTLKSCLDEISKKNNNFKHIKTPDGGDDRIYKKPVFKCKKARKIWINL